MEAATVSGAAAQRRRGRAGRWLRPLAFLTGPAAVLALFFLGPMIVMLAISLQYGVLSGQSGFTLSNFTDAVSDPLYRDVAWTTIQIATIAMLVQLAIAIPIAYVLAFKAGRWELPLLLFLVLADELNPMVRIYAWRMLLGREGLINEALQRIGIINHPIDALLFSKFAVIVVLSTSYLTYTVIPIYGAMKAIDKNLFEAALDLGAGWWTTARRILLPLIAPGVFVALLLVYIPLFTDFASPTLVGGTSGYMLGQVVNDLVLESGDLNGGAAVSLLMLLASAIFAVVAYKLARIRQLDVSSANGGGDYDAVIVGAGHNGLVAAYYLATAGLRVMVCERREIVGGCCVTEEFAPGYRASTGAYVLSMLREPVWRDLRLVERGIEVDPAGPALNLFADGSHLHLDDDLAVTQTGMRRFSPADAQALPEFEAELGRIAELIAPLIDTTPPDPAHLRPRELGRLAGLGARAARNRGQVADALYLFGTSANQYLSEHFASDQVRAALGWHAINDSTGGPSTPGTAFVLLHDHASEQTGGGIRQWGFVRGGIGRLTEAMADAAREAGATIRTAAPVERILVEDGRAAGVELTSGVQVRAVRVLSNADPKTTFLRLVANGAVPDRFRAAVEAYRCEGTSMKINLAVDRLPKAAAVDGDGVQPYHRGIMEVNPTVAQMDAGQAEARAGRPALDPHVELCIPTVHDPSLAPEGRHVVTIDVNSQPYTLADGTWDELRDEVADRAVAKLERYFPGLEDSICERQVLAPTDLESRLGIWGGHALHGEMAFDQLFNLRPVRGWADYRTPVRDLWLCGAGTHPGGGVTGANGRNCAREVIRDHRGLAARLRGARR